MANRRMASSDLFEDDFIGTLTFFERLVWIGMFVSCADDQGRFIDNHAIIRAKVFPFDRDVGDDMVETALNKFQQSGMIIRYSVNGRSIIQIVKWWKHQTPSWASPSKYPPPDGWVDKFKYHAAGGKIVMENWDRDAGFIGKAIGSRLCINTNDGIHSRIDESDVKDDDEVNGDDDVDIVPPSGGNIITQSDLKHFAEMTNLKPPTDQKHIAEWIQSLSRHREMGTTDTILRQTLTELAGKHYNITGPKSLEVPCMNTIAKTKRSRKERPRDCDGEFRELIRT